MNYNGVLSSGKFSRLWRFGPHSNFNSLLPEKTMRAYRIVSEHFQCQSSWKQHVFFCFFFKGSLPCSSVLLSIHSGAQSSVLSVWASVFWSPQPDFLTFLHFLFLFLSNAVSRTPPLTLQACVYVLASMCVCVFWSQRHYTLPTMYKNGPSVCACKCVCVSCTASWILVVTAVCSHSRPGVRQS